MDSYTPRVLDQTVVAGVSNSTQSADHTSSFGKVINWLAYALVLLVPIFFLPITTEFREFNKLSLIIVLTLAMAGIWMIKILINRKLNWAKTVLDLAVVGYVVVYLISSLLSVDKSSSFLGYTGRYTGSLFSIVALGLFYFVATNNLNSARNIKNVVRAMVLGSGLAIIYGITQIIGWFVLPSYTHNSAFNTVGSEVGLGMFAVASILFYQSLSISNSQIVKAQKIVLGVLSLLGLVLIFLLNSSMCWITLLLGMVVLLAIALGRKQHQNMSSFWQPMVVLILSVLFVAFMVLPSSVNPRNLFRTNVPTEITLSTKTTMNLVKNSFSSPKLALIGSGPGTVGIQFGLIKPESLNKTIVWSVNFDRASSEIGTIAIETGILGLIAFEGLALLFLVFALRYLLKQTDQTGQEYALGFFAVWAGLYIAHFMYFFNTSMLFMYWLSMAMFMVCAYQGRQIQESDSVAASGRTNALWMLGSLLGLAVILIGIFFEASMYVADTAYASGIKALNQNNPSFEKAGADFARAVNLNSYNDNYLLAYGQDLIFLASAEAAKKDGNVSAIQSWIASALAAGKRAVEISPNKASDWSALAQFYNSVKPLGVSGTDQFAIDDWQQAINHDNKNPILYVQLAQAYVNAASSIDFAALAQGTDSDHDGLSDVVEQKLGSDPNKADTNGNGMNDGDEVKAGLNPAGTGPLTSAQLAAITKVDQGKLKQAEDALNKAIVIKQDLPDSYIALARLYEQENKLSDAKAKIDEAAGLFPVNADIRYEQGRITFNQGKFDEAAAIFNNVLKIEPNHSNALYSLAMIDIQKGNKQAALEKLTKVRDLSGPNVGLDKLISDLKAATSTTPKTTK